ncbi:MAG: DNA cytosine methyltransferase, partial [Gammaproteobacteria bacterium]|nr:DNA cytosine methyltransferase [Gammaproteobacteria bacterium]
VFVVENVKGLLAKRHKSTIQAFYEMVERAGYRVLEFPWVLDAQDFGVPQRRQRVFLIGAKTGCRLPSLPEVHDERPVVWDAISDLTAIDEALDQIEGDLFHGKLGEPSNYAKTLRKQTDLPSDHSSSQEALTGCRLTAHSHTTLTRFAQTGQGDYESISRFFRLAENAVGPTLRAGTDRQNGSYTAPRPIHPIRDRCITVREAARLHSFPDWFRFHSTIWHGFRQIGNAVPPRLGSAVAKSILEVL